MDLELTEEQRLLIATARDFLAKEASTRHVREMEDDELGYSPQLWKKMADLGWLGLALPEEYGGTDGSLLDLGLLAEEVGRAALLGPFHSTLAQFAQAILLGGSEAQKQQLLAGVSAGEILGTLALTEPSNSYAADGIETYAKPSGGDFVINGCKLFVESANSADWLLTATRTPAGVALLLVPKQAPGIETNLLRTIDAARCCEVRFDGVRVPADHCVGRDGDGWPIIQRTLARATALLCAEMAGGARKAFEMTVDYAKLRVAFGQPIGKFQAIQHMIADMATMVDGAQLLTRWALWKIGRGEDAALEVSCAKSFTSESYKRVTAHAHQIHGGIAHMKEFDLQLWFRRAKAAELRLGDAVWHRELVAQGLGL